MASTNVCVPPPPLQELHYLWTAPIEATVILGLLASLTKQYATPAIAILLVVLALQYIFGWMIAKHKVTNSHNTSAR
jgi:ATP-binding cassette, subfamily C (CFTR/MRP), member 1